MIFTDRHGQVIGKIGIPEIKIIKKTKNVDKIAKVEPTKIGTDKYSEMDAEVVDKEIMFSQNKKYSLKNIDLNTLNEFIIKTINKKKKIKTSYQANSVMAVINPAVST